jgi:hypothetical protein
MAAPKLHQGVLVRQVINVDEERQVRLEFIPDDTSQNNISATRRWDDGEKRSWRYLLGNPRGVDIDTGILVVRFNKDNQSGVAVFMPGKSPSRTIRKIFHQRGSGGEGPWASLRQFNECFNSRRNAVRPPEQFDFWGAVSACAPLLRQEE